MTITDAAETGTHLELLVALRTKVAETVEGECAPRDLVGLSRRLMDIDSEVRQLQGKNEGLRLVPNDQPFDPEAI